MEIKVAGETLLLSKHKVIYWSDQQSLFIADLHLGKTTHFRKAGIAIPQGIIKAEIDRLNEIISDFRPKRIFFLGDLFHSDLNHEWDIFNAFIDSHPRINFVLVKGNHDILNEKVYKKSALQIEKEPFLLPPLVLSHHPLNETEIPDGHLNLCGHLHPGVHLKAKARNNLKLPCYFKTEKQLILPAFGKFTGLALVDKKKGNDIYVLLTESVEKINF